MITLQQHLFRNLKQVRRLTNSSVLFEKKDNTDKSDEKKLTKNEAADKLNDLLKLMLEKDNEQPTKEVHLAQPVKRKREKPEKDKPFGEKLAGAAKDVATTLGGDVEKTESELLNILLRRSESTPQMLKDVLSGIKVEKEEASESRAQRVRDSLGPKKFSDASRMTMDMRKPKKKTAAFVDILGATPSSYFTDIQPLPPPCELRTWNSCLVRDMRLAVTHPPSNIYEQMMLWTNQGKLWHFPIDNEQGMDSEKQISFEEHIFLENHLEGWCPEKGPVRNFMELVCIGLSKNHWLTVEEKKEHIMWFREYFADKKELLKEIGAGSINIESEEQQKLSA